MGGTGKTPVVRYIANLAVSRGYSTAVVARGYKRKSKGLIEVNDNSSWQDTGDEPLEIYRLTDKVRVYVHQSKTIAAKKACTDGAEVIIVDDGFQHRKLQRDINLVCLDWQKPYGPGGMLPLGLLREPRNNLKRADTILYTSYDEQIKPVDTIKLEMPSLYVKSSITCFKNLKSGAQKQFDDISGSKVLAFCGLANPAKFKSSLVQYGLEISKFITFKDHHNYSGHDVDLLLREAQNINADCLITTYKDAVKIESFDFGKFDIYSAMLDISIVDIKGVNSQGKFREILGL